MKYAIPFARLDLEREKASRVNGEVITYQASPELRAEIEAKIAKKMKEQENESVLAPIIPGGKIKRIRRDRENTFQLKSEYSENKR